MCDDTTLLKVFFIIDKILILIQIFVPLIIVVKAVFEVGGKSISSDPNNLFKVFGKIGTRILFALLIFFVPTILGFVFNIINPEYGTNNLNCLLKVTKEDIKRAEINSADEAITKAEEYATKQLYNTAKSKVDAIDDEEVKRAFLQRLNMVARTLELKQKEIDELNNQYIKEHLKETETQTVVNNKTSTSGVASEKNIKYYRQCDDNWRTIKYSKGTYETCRCGCGFTSLAMVIDGINNSANTPVDIVQNLLPIQESTCAINDETLTNAKIKSLYKIDHTVLFPRNNVTSAAESERRKGVIVEALENGYAVVLLIPGHYIALGSIENGKISAYNPGNRGDNGEYTIDELYNKFADYSKRCSHPTNIQKKACGFVYAVAYKKG